MGTLVGSNEETRAGSTGTQMRSGGNHQRQASHQSQLPAPLKQNRERKDACSSRLTRPWMHHERALEQMVSVLRYLGIQPRVRVLQHDVLQSLREELVLWRLSLALAGTEVVDLAEELLPSGSGGRGGDGGGPMRAETGGDVCEREMWKRGDAGGKVSERKGKGKGRGGEEG